MTQILVRAGFFLLMVVVGYIAKKLGECLVVSLRFDSRGRWGNRRCW